MSTIQEFVSGVSGYNDFDTVELNDRTDTVEVVFTGAPDGLRNQIEGVATDRYGLNVDKQNNDFWVISDQGM